MNINPDVLAALVRARQRDLLDEAASRTRETGARRWRRDRRRDDI